LPSACSNCGAPVDTDAVFCSRCGLNLTLEFASSPAAAATPPGATSSGAGDESDTFRRLRAALGDRYALERELGRGGMATVFLAKDVKHDRDVAIKVLHPDLSASIGAERFEREIRLAAKLQHPHILGLYDSGTADGLLYYVMPFVKGESLRDRIDREGMLPIEDAVRIALEVCSALGHAHEQGIIHRDIKPENILLSGDHALVADFGIARAATEAGQQKLTQTGMAVGTPVYMAPEQSSGDAVGPTADLYSLGCVLYEMLAGEPPFTGPNAMAIMARHLMETPPSVRVVRATVPEELEEAIYVVLNKAPVDRPQTAAQFAELVGLPLGATSTMRIMRASGGGRRTRATSAVTPFGTATLPMPQVPWWQRAEVRWTAFGLAIAAASTVFAFIKFGGGGGATALGEEARRVAVLYFEDGSSDSSLTAVADGLTDGLIRTLSTSPSITVISRGGVEPYRRGDVGVDSIARALRVGYLVRGAVEPERDRVRVTVRLDDASGVRLGSGGFAIARDSLLLVQDSLGVIAADLIREQLGAELRVQTQRAATSNTEAWLLLQRGAQAQRTAEEFTRRTAEARATGTADAQRVAALQGSADRSFAAADSLYALAEAQDRRWADPIAARAALAYRRSRLVGRAPELIRPWVTLGLEHADRALALDPDHPDALETRGTLRFFSYLQNLENDDTRKEQLRRDAQADLEHATRVNRNQAGAYATLAALYANLPEKTTSDVYLAAQRAYEADEFQANAVLVLARLFNAAYDLGNATAAEDYCRRFQVRFPADSRAMRCQLYLMTLPNASGIDIDRAWRISDSAVALTPAGAAQLAELTNHNLVAAAIARVARQQPALADSVRSVVRRSQGDGTIDQPRELALYGAVALTILGDHEEAVRLLGVYMAANPQSAEGLRDDPGWWFRPLADRTDWKQLVGGPR
jgi:TolB-like protein